MWSLEGSLNLKNENYVDSLSLIWAGQGSAPLPSCYYLHPGVFVHRAQPGAICLLPHPEVCGVEQGRPEWVPTATLGLSSPALLSSPSSPGTQLLVYIGVFKTNTVSLSSLAIGRPSLVQKKTKSQDTSAATPPGSNLSHPPINNFFKNRIQSIREEKPTN